MNRAHRIVVNRRTGARQAVSETAKASTGGRPALGCALAVGAALFVAAAPPARAQAQFVWVSPVVGSWFNPGNWDVGAVPTAADNVVVFGPGTAQVSGSGVVARANFFTITQADTEGSASVTNGGTLTVARSMFGFTGPATMLVDGANSVFNAGRLLVGFSAPGTLTVSNGGTVRAEVIELGADAGGVGTLNLNAGGTLETGGDNGLVPAKPVASDAFNWSGGTLRVSGANLNTGIDATLTGAGSTLDTNGLSATLSGVLSGGGELIKTGPGSLTLSGANTYGGGTRLFQGVLALGHASALGTGALLIADGQLQGTATMSVANPINLAGAATFAAGPGTTLRLTGQIAFGADLNIGAPGQNGTVEIASDNGGLLNAGDLRVNYGTLRSDGDMLARMVEVAPTTILASGASLDFNGGLGYPVSIRNLQGSGRISTGTIEASSVGVQAGDFAGSIEGRGNFEKHGSGTFTLRAAAAYEGATSVMGGSLVLAGGGALPTGSALLVNGGASFDASAISAAGMTVSTLSGVGTVQMGTKSLTLAGAANGNFSGSIHGSNALFKTGTGTLTLAGANTYTGGTSVSGGTLALAGAGSLIGSGAVDVASGATFSIAGLDAAGTTIGSLAGDGRVLLGAKTLRTVGAANAVFGGVIEGTGGLLKQGSGTFYLNGVNTYTGTTVVQAGRLSVGATAADSGARIAGAVDVASGATLGGFGSIGGDVTIGGGAHLAPGDPAAGNGIGTLRIGGNLTLGAGSQLDFDFGAPSGVASVPGQGDSVSVGGHLSISASTLNVRNAGGMGPGLYNLFTWGSGLTIAGGGFAPPAGSSVQILTSSKQINLITAAGYTLNFWNGNGLASPSQLGGGDGIWSATQPNWADEGGVASGPLQPQPGFAIFGGAAGNVVVNTADGAVAASGMQFASDGYRVSGGNLTLLADAGHPAPVEVRVGDGSAASASWTATIANSIAGSDGLAKTGAGTLVLGGANSYTGGTTVRAGTLQVAADNNLGAAGEGLTLDGGTLRATSGFATHRAVTLGAGGGGVEVDPIQVLGLNGAVSGDGALVKTGRGTLVLGSANSHTGGTAVNAGSLEAAVAGALGSGPVSVAANASLLFTGSADASGVTITAAERGGTGNAGFVRFGGSSSAGNARLVMNNGATAEFRDNASAGNAVIENHGGLSNFSFNATAGKATITNFADGQINLLNNASAGQANFINRRGGLIDVFDNATADQATVFNEAGARLRIRSLAVDGISIGSLSGAGEVILGAKALTTGGLNADTEISGAISGTGGSIVKVGSGALTLSGANTYTGGTALRQGRLNVAHNQALGSGVLTMDDDTTLGFGADGLNIANAIQLTGKNDPVIDTGAFDGTLSGGISGGGFITKQGTGTLTLLGSNSYTGATHVAQGTLKAGSAGTLSASSAHSVAAGATLDLAGFNQTVASLANSGTVSLMGATPGTTLTVNGNYAGNNGVLRLGTALNATGPSDRLVINGGTASGKTSVQFANLGGLGALTGGDGIEVITALNGATTTAQTTKDAFTLAGGQVNAGAYEYRLYAADASGAGENWYLRSSIPGATPPAAPVITYRAEASLYAALPNQLRQGNLAMLGDLRKRVGDDDVKGTATTPTGADRRAWARVLSSDIDIRQGGTVSPTSTGRWTGFQAGTDLLTTPNWRAGLYVGQLDGDASVSGFASGVNHLRAGRADLRSQYVGVYGTYTGDSGFYADAVVQSTRHRYTVQSSIGMGAEGKGNSLLGSLEVGQIFALGGSGWRIEPQLQLIHQRLDLGNSTIVGAAVQPDADSGWIARAGVRVKGRIDTGLGTLQPYGRFNVYKASSGTDIAHFLHGATSTGIEAPTGGTSTELAGGFTLALGQTTSLYGEIGKLWSSGGNAKVKSSINGSIGVRVKW
ncbi:MULTISPECIES: autotransporter outer membrane beta-barrel domain-containing protein [Variovorax]|uniref:autotransporter outer membrane beta-barrel domain-containing protein n=1 Tax=Variovorax TaxID=34072 RepID=UPI00285950F0|nr:autotransporter outer membrane beta-barrel domain-containing protein [Variovorax sp. 3319]MDR6890899.1 outer membrane autotransporter protein [Variovorax sp. 3319]